MLNVVHRKKETFGATATKMGGPSEEKSINGEARY